ncbi:hypothetical protein GPECTOR_196g338 [Gonium pectorale]|uniref:Apple domain-containing protein n=1 Tax=Gonium pectorale TaxID=33097 RepID=A0A150FX17_GONPE|nr:hypothetical protein GPECTOR_196g338 [Gonium pectorale]|eukprot:KXZ42146.1 hypothetical protein GPECTOR_196g338 [Gonium pectorale]
MSPGTGADPGCLPGVDMTGESGGSGVGFTFRTREACRDLCEKTAGCTFSVRTKAGTCWLKSVPLTGTKGTNAVSSGIDQTCFKRSNTGQAGCISGIDIRGTDVTNAPASSREACRQQCDGNAK